MSYQAGCFSRFTGIGVALAGLLFLWPFSLAGTAADSGKTRTAERIRAKTEKTGEAEEKRVQALSHYSFGIVNELNDNATEALDAYYQSAMQDPSHEVLVAELAPRLLHAKQTGKAVDLLKRAVDIPGSSGVVHAWLGVAQAQAGRFKAAIQACRTAIKRSPTISLPYQTLAEVRLQQDKPAEAARVIRQALNVPNTNPEFLLEIVETAIHVQDAVPRKNDTLKLQITNALDRVQKADPDSPLVLQRIGDGYRGIGEFDKAVAVYQELMRRFSAVTGMKEAMRERLVDTHLRAGNKKAAIQLLDDMLKENPTNAQGYLAAGAILTEAKDYAAAIEYFEKALLLNPALEPVHYELAGLHITLNQPQKALDILNNARGKFAANFTLELYTALAYSRLKEYQEALKYFTAAEITANATDPKRLNHAFHFQLGATFERIGDFEQAEKSFRKCLELSPSDAEAMNYMGYMWAEKGIRLEEARLWIEKALKLEPDNAAFLDSMGWVLFKLNQPRPALNYLLKAAATSEEPDATIQDHLGDVHAALRQWEKAVSAWKKSILIEPSEPVRKKLESAPIAR